MWACGTADGVEAVKVLLAAGVDLKARDNVGNLATGMADYYRCAVIIRVVGYNLWFCLQAVLILPSTLCHIYTGRPYRSLGRQKQHRHQYYPAA